MYKFYRKVYRHGADSVPYDEYRYYRVSNGLFAYRVQQEGSLTVEKITIQPMNFDKSEFYIEECRKSLQPWLIQKNDDNTPPFNAKDNFTVYPSYVSKAIHYKCKGFNDLDEVSDFAECENPNKKTSIMKIDYNAKCESYKVQLEPQGFDSDYTVSCGLAGVYYDYYTSKCGSGRKTLEEKPTYR